MGAVSRSPETQRMSELPGLGEPQALVTMWMDSKGTATACSFQHQRSKSHPPLGFTQNPRGWAGGRTGRGRWGRQEAEGRAQPASRLLQDSQTRFWTQPTSTLTQTPTPSRAQTPRRPGFGVRCATLPLLNAPLHHLGWGRGAEVLRPQAPAEFLGSAGPRALEGHPPR